MKKFKLFTASTVGVLILAMFVSFAFEYSRPIPDNLTVFVLNRPEQPKEFYSSPHAYQLLQQNIPLAKMPMSRARAMNLKMADASKKDFDCYHNTLIWFLTDRGLWPNYCRWNKDAEWQGEGAYAKTLRFFTGLYHR